MQWRAEVWWCKGQLLDCMPPYQIIQECWGMWILRNIGTAKKDDPNHIQKDYATKTSPHIRSKKKKRVRASYHVTQSNWTL